MNPHVFISAGTKGLGRQVAEYFLKQGHFVTVSYFKDEKAGQAMKKELDQYQQSLHLVQGDVTIKEDIDRMIASSKERFGPVSILVCNAGPYIFERKKLADYESTEWNAMVQGNLSSVFHFFKACVADMRKAKFGRIITYGFQDASNAPGWMDRSAFAAAKTGLVSLTRTIAQEEAASGITANMVCPGDISGKMKEATIEEIDENLGEPAPVGRPGTGEDIARAVAFFADASSDFITGAIMEVTGGQNVVHRKV
ncbi:SDR family oxidoreductase [Bacillaceae bacterium SIJ1]|uniref:SDR family oxidoreductase n=1 Tax=Litoribacterium kuwaitense TaxID=1398745 RepID=UPI0013ED7E6A|nr:SDR family oxidoreductase [Litoribacterium kuwaitense]NGP44170.1 SDR family oxidoreductase [Litoribacterium kuwaitense]